MKRQYKIMITLGAAKSCGVFEVWGENVTPAYGAAWCAADFSHHGYFQTREDAQAWIDRRIDSDCPSNSRQVEGTAG